jgi:hypothetical protein
MKHFCIALAILAQSALFAANVPVEWTADVESLQVQNLSARRGETLELAVSLTYRGKPFTPEGDWEIFYQTNGMTDVYFTFPVNLEGNVARLTFTPSMDPGAERITGFIGRRGVNYRAAFALKFYGSPGAMPNALTLPTKTIDFAQLEVKNAPWSTAADIADKRDKSDLTVYETRKTPRLPSDALPVTFGGKTYAANELTWFSVMHDELLTELWVGNQPKDFVGFFNTDGTPRGLGNVLFAGRAPDMGVWPKLEYEDVVTPTKNQLAHTGDIDQALSGVTPEKIGAYPQSAGASLQNQVSAIGAYLNAEDARFVSTNYDSTVHLPEAYFEIKRPDGSWAVMWREMTRWNWFLEGAWCAATNTLAQKGEKEWGFYDAATGAPAPDGFAWISMPRVALCAGAAYQRIATASGAYWVLEANGLVAQINGTTNGYFRIEDEEGAVQFEVVKGDKRTIFAAPGSQTVEVMGVTHVFTSYEIDGALEPPVAYFTRRFDPVEWFAATDPACPFNASWTQNGSTWTCEWWPKSAEPSGFMRAAFAVGGETRIKNHAPVEFSKIVIGGVTYTAAVEEMNGRKVLVLK